MNRPRQISDIDFKPIYEILNKIFKSLTCNQVNKISDFAIDAYNYWVRIKWKHLALPMDIISDHTLRRESSAHFDFKSIIDSIIDFITKYDLQSYDQSSINTIDSIMPVVIELYILITPEQYTELESVSLNLINRARQYSIDNAITLHRTEINVNEIDCVDINITPLVKSLITMLFEHKAIKKEVLELMDFE